MLSSLLAATGYSVSREYYINDALNSVQMNNFGRSVFLRYRELLGKPLPYPTEGEDAPDWLYQGEYITRLLSLTPEDRALSWLPLFHDMGLILGLLQPIYAGFPVYLSSPVAFVKRPGAWLQAIASLGVTLSGGPDFAYDLCCEAVDPTTLAGLDLSRWTIEVAPDLESMLASAARVRWPAGAWEQG